MYIGRKGMDVERTAHKGLIGYKVFICKWSEAADREIMKDLVVDLAGYSEEEAARVIDRNLPLKLADSLTRSGAVYLAAAMEMYGCKAAIYYNDEFIEYDEEIPEIFAAGGELTDKAGDVFARISGRSRVRDTALYEVNESSFGRYAMFSEDVVKNHVRRNVVHRVIGRKPAGYTPDTLGWTRGRGSGDN